LDSFVKGFRRRREIRIYNLFTVASVIGNGIKKRSDLRRGEFMVEFLGHLRDQPGQEVYGSFSGKLEFRRIPIGHGNDRFMLVFVPVQ